MSGLRELLSAELPVEPLVQAAPDGRWERAVVIDGNPAAFLEPMSNGVGHLGVEVMWPGNAFVGAAFPAEQWQQAADAVTRVLATIGASDATHGVPGRITAAAGLRALLDGEPGDRAAFAQLGAVNAWSSVGAETLWREGESYSPRTVDAVLDRRPDLARNCAHPVAVEFGLAGQQARPGWVAFYVAPPGGPVDRARLHAVLARVTADPVRP
ncbi:hypothetical protein [Catellatospora tritici]|uniref:hypothetical protein n=1 Tax=Catellatospora tritici TaxID=2851566 RepID=UPI001C2CD7F1|nr:hypothetical protein [Catellatospora tritici]MBV1855823.1 hypothetical protein [Catellatospora tritici]